MPLFCIAIEKHLEGKLECLGGKLECLGGKLECLGEKLPLHSLNFTLIRLQSTSLCSFWLEMKRQSSRHDNDRYLANRESHFEIILFQKM